MLIFASVSTTKHITPVQIPCQNSAKAGFSDSFNDSEIHGVIQRLQTDVSCLLRIIDFDKQAQSRAARPSNSDAPNSPVNERIKRYTLPLQRFLERTSMVMSLASATTEGRDSTATTETASDIRDFAVEKSYQAESAIVSPTSAHDDTLASCCVSPIEPFFWDSLPAPSRVPPPPPAPPVELDAVSTSVADKLSLPDDIVSSPNPAALGSPSMFIELEACEEDCVSGCAESLATIPESECDCDGVQETPSITRLPSEQSFVPGLEDVLDLAARPQRPPEDHQRRFLRYLSRRSADSWLAHPENEGCDLRRRSAEEQPTSFEIYAEPETLPATSDCANEAKPQLKLLIPAAPSPGSAPEDPRSRCQSFPSTSFDHDIFPGDVPPPLFSSTRQQPLQLPPLRFSAADLSALSSSPPITNASLSVTSIPELDFGPEVTPEDRTAPWSASPDRPDPFPFASDCLYGETKSVGRRPAASSKAQAGDGASSPCDGLALLVVRNRSR